MFLHPLECFVRWISPSQAAEVKQNEAPLSRVLRSGQKYLIPLALEMSPDRHLCETPSGTLVATNQKIGRPRPGVIF